MAYKIIKEEPNTDKWNDRNTLCRFCRNSIFDIDKVNADKNCKSWRQPKVKPLTAYKSDKNFFCSHFEPTKAYKKYILEGSKDSISDVDVGKIEKVINEIYPGLQMFVRDVNLSEKCFDQYKVGMIIKERGFTDASARVMGMKTKHRYTILSNHMADFSSFEHDTDWELYVAQRNSHFKVIDIYTYHNKTQILLLHLPDNDDWKLFTNTEVRLENKDIINESRERFEIKCEMDLIPELATEQWIQRCKMPLGMDLNGNLFELD